MARPRRAIVTNREPTVSFLGLVALWLPPWLLDSGTPFLLVQLAVVVLVCATGFLLGLYFPRGLLLAKRYGLESRVPHLFAINSICGSFAAGAALWLAVRYGYQVTMLGALAMYPLAALVLRLAQTRLADR